MLVYCPGCSICFCGGR